MDRLRQEPHASQGSHHVPPPGRDFGLHGGSRHDRRLRPQRHAADARRSRTGGDALANRISSVRYRALQQSGGSQRPAVLERCAVLCWLQSWAARLPGAARSATLVSGGSGRGARFVAQGRIGLGRRKSAGRRVCGRAPKGRPPEPAGAACRWAAESWSAKSAGVEAPASGSHRSLTVATRRRVSCIHSLVPAQTPTFATPGLSARSCEVRLPRSQSFGCDRYQKIAPNSDSSPRPAYVKSEYGESGDPT